MTRRNATLAEVVADALRQSLRDGVYTCGDRLVELTIGQEMNVSQNTARDALSILEREGWVVKRPRHGVYVRDFTTDEAEELFMIRIALEQLALEWAIDRVTATQTEQLEDHLQKAQSSLAAGHTIGFQQARLAFHRAFVEFAQRPRTAGLLRRIHNQMQLMDHLRRFHDPHSLEIYAKLMGRYDDLLGEIRAHNLPSAGDSLKAVLYEDCRTLLPILDLVGRR